MNHELSAREWSLRLGVVRIGHYIGFSTARQHQPGYTLASLGVQQKHNYKARGGNPKLKKGSRRFEVKPAEKPN